MKKKLFSKACKQTILAIPAAALMLGASHAGMVGINYTENFGAYAANGTGAPYNYGTGSGYFSYGYMTTGMNVSATAFGVPAANWSNIQLPFNSVINSTNVVGPMTVVTTAAAAAQCSGIGNTNFVVANYFSWFMPAGVQPGNDEVTWGYLDDATIVPPPAYTNMTYTMWNVTLSGMNAAHPNGYTIQTIAYPWIFDPTTNTVPAVNISDFATFTNSMDYTDLGARQGAWGNDISHATISSVSPVMTSDVVNIYGNPPWLPVVYYGVGKNAQRVHSTLCGFIITDAATLVLSVVGTNLVWTAGTLQSSPTLGAGAVWTTLNSAISPYPFLPSTAPQMFYRLKN